MIPTVQPAAPVATNQPGPHPRLRQVVERHLSRPWRQPLHAPTVRAWTQFRQRHGGWLDGPLVLDAGCGTGDSSVALASLHPGAHILGVDRSAARLRRGAGRRAGFQRVRCLRADLATLWRLLHRDGLRLEAHYLLYPNPWPKAAHLGRRWHGHPVFSDLLALGGRLEMRTNWELYAREFALAVGWVTGIETLPESLTVTRPLSPFERKYTSSGHRSWRVTADLRKVERLGTADGERG